MSGKLNLFNLKALALLLSGGFALLAPAAQAQNLQDAARLSDLGPVGTARSRAMDGAFTAVGGDWSSATLNPAGLGIYRHSQLQMTMGMHVASTQTSMLGFSGTGTGGQFTVPSLSMVFTGKTNNESGLKSWAFGFGYNQYSVYNRHISLSQAYNPVNSITSFAADNANNINFNNLINSDNISYAAFSAYANNSRASGYTAFIDTTLGTDSLYAGAFDNGQIYQTVTSTESGRRNEWNFALAGNFSDRLYLGASLNVADIRYKYERTILEQDLSNAYSATSPNPDPQTHYVNQVTYHDKYRTTGEGVGLSVGLIYQPTDFMRIGFSAKSPQLVSLHDSYSTDITIRDDFGNVSPTSSTPKGSWDYKFTMPYELNGGIMFQFGKVGILSADVGCTNYNTAQYGVTLANQANYGSYYSQLNKQIANNMGFGYNLRIGGEVRLDKYYIRAGFGYYSSQWVDSASKYRDPYNLYDYPNPPTKLSHRTDLTRFIYSGGVGYRGESFFLDLAYIQDMRTDLLPLYNNTATMPGSGLSAGRAIQSPTMVARRSMGSVLVTMGFNFGN